MAGRLLLGNAYQKGQGTTHNADLYNSRTHIAQIKSVDTKNGRITLALETVSAGGDPATVVMPLGGLSINKSASSWQRYMPSANAYVKVGYGIANHLEVLGYALPAVETAQGVEGQRAADASGNVSTDQRTGGGDPRTNGYALIRKLAEEARKNGETGGAAPSGLGPFRDLEQGELDFHSSGGADIFLSKSGRVQLSAGQT